MSVEALWVEWLALWEFVYADKFLDTLGIKENETKE
jgi:hypothetical protein